MSLVLLPLSLAIEGFGENCIPTKTVRRIHTFPYVPHHNWKSYFLAFSSLLGREKQTRQG